MDIFEEATDAIIHSVDSQDRSQAQDPPTYGHWLGSGWGKDSWPHFLRQFYPNNPRPNNGNKRKNARTETVSAVRSRRQSPGWISSQSSTAVTFNISKILTSNRSTRGFCNSKFHFCGVCLSLCSCQAGTNQWSVNSWKIDQLVTLFLGWRRVLFTTEESTVRLLSSRPNPLL